jgi:hypothetical protein
MCNLGLLLSKYLNFATPSRGFFIGYLMMLSSNSLLAVFMLWFYLEFWWKDMNVYLVLSMFTSKPPALLVFNSFCTHRPKVNYI